MKFIHTADLHLDSRLETNLDPIKAKERKRELLLSFENMVNYAKNNHMDGVLLSGDFFDKNHISEKTREYVLGLIDDFSELEFIYIYGNHDMNALASYMEDIPSNLHIIGDSWEKISFDGIDITAMSGEKFTPADYDNLLLDRSKVNIVMMHGDISSRDSINLALLKNKNIDYLALGHIHKYSKGRIDDRGIYVYPGCPEGRGFDEAGEKGFVIVDINGTDVTTEFVPFAKRVLHDISVDISNCDSWMEVRKSVNLRLTDISPQDMVRIRLVGTYEIQLLKQNELLEGALNQQFYFAKVTDESHLRINPSDYENDISLKGEFIRNVLESNLPEEDIIHIIEYGIKALMKEEL